MPIKPWLAEGKTGQDSKNRSKSNKAFVQFMPNQYKCSLQTMNSEVTVIHIKNNKDKDTIERLFTLLGVKRHNEHKVISIKVNLCDYRMADSGATTDPYLLETLVLVLKSYYPNSDINILENDATTVEANSLFSLLGFRDVFKTYADVNLVNVAKQEWINKAVPRSCFFRELEIPELIEKSDIFINFAKLKTNILTKTTGCLKNNFAFIRDKKKSVHHGVIDKVIADINQLIKTDICVVDGLIGMEGLGPAFGIPKKCNLLVAGKDTVSVDACCARIMGFNPRFVRHIMRCYNCGIGNIKYSLQSDMPDFSYGNYKFTFSQAEYFARLIIRKFAHLGVAG